MMIKRILSLLILPLAPLIAQGDDNPLNATLESYDYPYPVQYLPLELQQQSLQMAYMDMQPAQPNGHCVLLLHGKNFPSAYWEAVIRDLCTAGYRVVAPDQIGFGKSTKPEHFQYTFQVLAQNTKALLDQLGVEKAVVQGHSMGGMLATRFALMFPEATEALVLEDPIGLEDWKLKVPYQSVDQWYASELKKTKEGLQKYQQESYYHGEWKEEYQPWVDVLYRWTLSPDYPLVAWNAALTYDMIFTQPVVYEFSKIQVPTLLVVGQLDRTALGKAKVSEEVRGTMGNYPALGKKTAAAIPSAKLVQLEGVGHVPHIEAPDQFREVLLEFLKGLQ